MLQNDFGMRLTGGVDHTATLTGDEGDLVATLLQKSLSVCNIAFCQYHTFGGDVTASSGVSDLTIQGLEFFIQFHDLGLLFYVF